VSETIGQSRTDQLAGVRVESAPVRDRHPDWLADLAADLDLATRVAMRLRPDGLIEICVAGVPVGFVEHVAPVFVALVGDRPAVAVEIAQRLTLDAAVDVLRSLREGPPA
jgi:hypothetical protein